jgi:hypothetical protein
MAAFALVGPQHPTYELLLSLFPEPSRGAALAVALSTFRDAKRDRKRQAFLARRLRRRRKASR